MSEAECMAVLWAFIASLGFAIFLKIKGRQIFFAGIGGALCWLVYLLAYDALESYFTANFMAAVLVAIYAEIMARVNRAPTTIFLTAAGVPLVPGRNLYYMMYGIVSEDYEKAAENGVTLCAITLAIALGFVAVTIVLKLAFDAMKLGEKNV